MPAPLLPEWVLQGPERDQTQVPLALGESGFGETRPLGAGFATVLVLLSPATPPPEVPVVSSGPNLNVTSPRKLSPTPASTAGQLLKKLHMESAQDPAIPLLGRDPREVKTGSLAKMYTRIFITALFIMTKNIENCPNVHPWMNG